MDSTSSVLSNNRTRSLVEPLSQCALEQHLTPPKKKAEAERVQETSTKNENKRIKNERGSKRALELYSEEGYTNA